MVAPADSPAHRALAGGGELGRLIRSHDWSATSLGPISGWPQSLMTSLSVVLNAQMPMWLGWGPDIIFFYNDAYIDVLSQAKHPWALGRPAAEVWREIWHVCGPLAAICKTFWRRMLTTSMSWSLRRVMCPAST